MMLSIFKVTANIINTPLKNNRFYLAGIPAQSVGQGGEPPHNLLRFLQYREDIYGNNAVQAVLHHKFPTDYKDS